MYIFLLHAFNIFCSIKIIVYIVYTLLNIVSLFIIKGIPPGIPAREKKLVTDGVNVQTSRGVIPFNALKPNIDGSSQCILPTDVGSRIGIMYVPQAGCPDKAEMHFIINGEDQGVCGKDIPYKAGPLRAVVDVYGTTKQVRIIQLYGGEYLY